MAFGCATSTTGARSAKPPCRQNLGSFSTACNCKCAFCYEDGNPKGLFEKQPRFVGMSEARTRFRHLHDGKGLLRESKGFFEPLANPDFLALLGLIREHEPEHVIDVTTNGALLTRRDRVAARRAQARLCERVAGLRRLEDATQRHGGPAGGVGDRAIELLRESEIPFMGTVVPWPEQGLDDIARTIEFLDSKDARLIRVSMPRSDAVSPDVRTGHDRGLATAGRAARAAAAHAPEDAAHHQPLRLRLDLT